MSFEFSMINRKINKKNRRPFAPDTLIHDLGKKTASDFFVDKILSHESRRLKTINQSVAAVLKLQRFLHKRRLNGASSPQSPHQLVTNFHRVHKLISSALLQCKINSKFAEATTI